MSRSAMCFRNAFKYQFLYLLLYLIFSSAFFYNICFASPLIPGGYVTSPFNEANHFGHTHQGIDIALGSGTPILAPATGVVTHGSGNGYIYWCQIDCDDGITYFIGDCRQDTLSCPTGSVSEGTIIGFTGGDAEDSQLGLGYSTGPHAHIEVYDGTGYVLGAAVDPVPYLTSIGVNMSGDLYPEGDGQHFGAYGSDNVELPWGVESMYELGSELNKVIRYFSEGAGKGFSQLQGHIRQLLYFLIIIDFCGSIIIKGMGFSKTVFLTKILKYCFWIYVIGSWDELMNSLFLGFIESVTTTATDNSNLVTANLTQPQLILQKCIFLLEPALNKIASYEAADFLMNLHFILPIFIVTWFTILVYLLLCCRIVLSYVQFYFQGIVAFTLLPFNAANYTEGIGRSSLGNLISCTMELTFRGILIFLAVTILKEASPGQIFSITDTAGHKTYLTSAAVIKQITLCANLLLMAYLLDSVPRKLGRCFQGAVV